MADKNIQPRSGKFGKSAVKVRIEKDKPFQYIPFKEKVEFEVRDTIRAYPEDYPEILAGLAEFFSKWD